jgi:hypothetical protein
VMGMCYGPCVPANECAEVDTCAQCDATQHVCVNEVAQLGPTPHCVDVPAACQNMADCACMGSSVCVGAFNQCVDGPAQQISCQCPTC